jgi:hypothetical protein
VRIWTGVRACRLAATVHVAEEHPSIALERVERSPHRVIAALPVRHRHRERPGCGRACVNGVSAAPRRSRPAAREPQRRGCAAAPGHEPGLGEHLEAVADPEDEPPSAANAATARMTGLNRAMTPARR